MISFIIFIALCLGLLALALMYSGLFLIGAPYASNTRNPKNKRIAVEAVCFSLMIAALFAIDRYFEYVTTDFRSLLITAGF